MAKERKTKKAVVQKRQVRNQRDESFEQIELRDDRPIYRICDSSFAMKKYNNLEDINKNSVNTAQILKCLRGDLDRYNGYFWISC